LKLGESVIGQLDGQIPTLQRIASRSLLPGHTEPIERPESQATFIVLVSNAFNVPSTVGEGVETDLKLGIVPYEIADQIRSLLRQAGFSDGSSIVDARNRVVERGTVRLSVPSHVVTAGGCQVNLTTAEFDLLEVLMQTAGRALTREYLTRIVLKRNLMPYDRSIDVHVSNLRKKLRAANGEDCIKTIRGVGYLYVCPEPEDQSPKKVFDSSSFVGHTSSVPTGLVVE
jgi:DNA-binding winged helix-turn-helix (wHTH) protein